MLHKVACKKANCSFNYRSFSLNIFWYERRIPVSNAFSIFSAENRSDENGSETTKFTEKLLSYCPLVWLF